MQRQVEKELAEAREVGTVLPSEKGTRFFYRALAKKRVAAKRKKRKTARASRRKNRK